MGHSRGAARHGGISKIGQSAGGELQRKFGGVKPGECRFHEPKRLGRGLIIKVVLL